MYSGKAGASSSTGGGGNYICLPEDPEYLEYTRNVQGYSYVNVAEYENPVQRDKDDHDVPCAVCHAANKSSVLMIPSKVSCSEDWTKEYYGYLMSDSNYRLTYACVDVALEVIPNSGGDRITEASFFSVEARCDSLSCPPYDREKELTCVVCSK